MRCRGGHGLLTAKITGGAATRSIRYLIVPGWHGSPDEHWQSASHPPGQSRIERSTRKRAWELRAASCERYSGAALLAVTMRGNSGADFSQFLQQCFSGLDLAQSETQQANAVRQIARKGASIFFVDAGQWPADPVQQKGSAAEGGGEG
ncbi:MAG TPA: hypothetical protein DHV63_13270 [Pseudomonas sp.]|nr:hypothetical protein [Pseudomonas sp.]